MKDIKLRLALDENRIHCVDINNAKISEKYYCPFCGNEVYPKALESDYVRRHFCHYTAECRKEGIEHLMTKYFILDKDILSLENISINIDKTKTVVEQSYKTNYGIYKPDVTIFTIDGHRIFLEVKQSNEKNDDFILKYTELQSDVIEYDINSNSMYYIYKNNNYCGKLSKHRELDTQIRFSQYLKSVAWDENKVQKLTNFWIECRKYKITKDRESILKAYLELDNSDCIFAITIISNFECVEEIKEIFLDNLDVSFKNKGLLSCIDIYVKLRNITKKEFANQINIDVNIFYRYLSGKIYKKYLNDFITRKCIEEIGIKDNNCYAYRIDRSVIIESANGNYGLGFRCSNCHKHFNCWVNKHSIILYKPEFCPACFHELKYNTEDFDVEGCNIEPSEGRKRLLKGYIGN